MFSCGRLQCVQQVVQEAFVRVVHDYSYNIAEQTATLHRRMKGKAVFAESFQVRRVAVEHEPTALVA